MPPFRLGLLLAGLALAAPPGGDPPAAPFRFPEGRYGAGELRYLEGLPVLTVAGTPEEIGTQTGVLAVRPAARVCRYPREMLEHYHLGFLWPTALRQGRALLDRFPPDHRRELDALAAAVPGVDADLFVAGNTLFDVKKLAGCASVIVSGPRSRTGRALLGRNLDFPTLGYLHNYSLVTVYRPAGKRAFGAVTFPGVLGCLSGMNDAGLTLTTHEVYMTHDRSKGFDPQGVPYALAFRRVLEECATLDEAEVLLRSLPRTTANNLAVCDGLGQMAVFEITPNSVVIRQSEQGLVCCTNHFVSKPLAVRPQPNLYATNTRYQKLMALQEKGTLDRGDVERALHAANKGSHTLQTMIFEPQTLTLHLAIGACPTSAGPYRTLALAPLLRPGFPGWPAGR